jgi:carbon storage regulator CsrA
MSGWLCLSRKPGETVTLVLPDGREATVRVIELRPDKVRLGFSAPADVVIFREELRGAFGRAPPGRAPGADVPGAKPA